MNYGPQFVQTANQIAVGTVAAREPAAAELLKMAEALQQRAQSLSDRMLSKLAPITLERPVDSGPITANERCYPPLFDQLRHHVKMVSEYLDVMEDTLSRVEL